MTSLIAKVHSCAIVEDKFNYLEEPDKFVNAFFSQQCLLRTKKRFVILPLYNNSFSTKKPHSLMRKELVLLLMDQ